MPRAAPLFPAFDEWQKMSENEQDALLDALEVGQQRRNRLAAGILIGLGGLTVAAAFGGLTFLLLH